MRAIEKDRKRRYSSASELARDVALYFRNEPVSARKPGVAYRFTKFAKRRRGRILAGAGMTSAILLGAVAARTWSGGSSSPSAPPKRTQFTSSGKASEPALAPDGQKIAYVDGTCLPAGDTCLVEQDLSGGPPVSLAHGADIIQPKWHPAGGSIMFQARRVRGAADTTGGSYMLLAAGGVPRRIGPGGAGAFSSSGDSVVLATQVGVDDTVQLRFLGTADLEVRDSLSVQFTNGGLNDLDWSPDGKWLALLVYRGQADRRLVLISRRNGTISDSMRVPGHQLVRWVPQGDGVLLLLQSASSENFVFRRGVDRRTGRFTSDTATVVEIPRGGSTFGISRDGTTIAYEDGGSITTEFIAMERDSGRFTARSLHTFTGRFTGPELSPDGQAIAFSRADALGENLYLVPFAGGPERPITSEADRHTSPKWLRDDRLVFKKGQPSTQLYVVHVSGSRPRPFGPAGYTTGDPWYLQWFDDSTYVLDERDHHRVLVVDARGSIRDTLAVPDTLDQLFTVTPDARQLWFFEGGPVHEARAFYSVDRFTKEVKLAFAAEKGRAGPGLLLGWVDGAYFVARWPNPPAAGPPTLWHVNSDGTFTRTVDLPADCSFRSLSMSRDGRRFVCSRTNGRSDIWLMRGVNLGR